MTAWLDKLNLQPQERRMVLGGLVVVALVLNYWIIWPYFGEWSKVGNEISKADSRKTTFLAEIASSPAVVQPKGPPPVAATNKTSAAKPAKK